MVRLLIAALLVPQLAAAEPITDREYAIDFYDGVALGSSTQIGMGGAGTALLVGSAGTLLNAAAPAMRETTDTEGWSWDYHLDLLSGRYSTDYDNNGQVASEASGAALATFGASLRIGNWAGAVTTTAQSTPVAGSTLDAEAVRVKGVLAYYFADRDLSVGIGFQAVSFHLGPQERPLFTITGSGAIAGATYVPRFRDWRAALAVESAIAGGDVEAAACDPANCQGYILPRTVEASARVLLGGAYRVAPTAWNQLVGGVFRDERSLTVAADLVVAGPTQAGHGIEGFGMGELQRSGRHVAVSPRLGAELEALPGRLRVRAGTYWEPQRFDGVPGRLHGTIGVDLRVFEVDVFGRRRGRLGATADIAARYRNVAVSIGFWH